MANPFLDATTLTMLALTTNPKWTEVTALDTGADPTAFTGIGSAPPLATSGVYLEESTGCLLKASLRVLGKSHDPDASDSTAVDKRSARLTIATFNAVGEYTFTADGTSITTVAQPYADVAAALAQVKTDIEANGTLNALLTVTEVDSSGGSTTDTLLIQGKGQADYVIDAWSVSAGAVAAIADPKSLTLKVYGLPKGVGTNSHPTPPGWDLVGEYDVTDYRGFLERLEVGGMDRMAVEVVSVAAVTGDASAITYAYRVWVGPGLIPGRNA